MSSRRRFLALATALPLAACGSARPAAPVLQRNKPRSGQWIAARRERGAISPYVYGSNTGPWQTVAPDQWQQSRDAGMTIVRWPGGNWGDENSVTPLQVDEYITACQRFGITPLIHVRLFDGTPAEAAALVRLVNIERGYGVRYWAIGNEPDLFVRKRNRDVYNVSDYVNDFRAFRAAMRAVDPSIIVMGPETSQYSDPTSYPVDAVGVPWMQGFLEAMAGDIDMVSFHRYPFGDPPPTPAALLAEPPAWTRAMTSLRQLVDVSAGGKRIPIACTEANSDWTGRVDRESGTSSHLNALWWTDVLGRLIAAEAQIVTHFCLGAISAQGIGLFGQISYDPRPTRVFEAYRVFQRFGNRLLDAGSDDATLPLVAARRNDGAITAVLVNHSTQSRPLDLTIEGFSSQGPTDVWSFAADHRVRQQTLAAGQPVILAPRSAAMIARWGD